jgi:hypothetical protein
MAKVLTWSDTNKTIVEQDIATGGEAVNIENLTADKYLTASDAPIQMYTYNTVNLKVYLPTTGLTAGQKFVIWNKNPYNFDGYLLIRTTSTLLYYLDPQGKIELRWDGSNWIPEWKQNIAIGFDTANNFTNGVGVGEDAYSNYSCGVGLGKMANLNYLYAVGVGAYATSNGKQHNTVTIGAYTQAQRNREIVSTATASTTNKAQLTLQKYVEKDLASNSGAWQELFIDGSSARLNIIASSVYQFLLQINAIDKTNFTCKTWEIKGAIKRNNSNVTTLVGTPTKTVTGADTGTTNWDVQVSADDTNEALKIEVKHDSANQVRFSLNIFATETRV